MVTTSPLVGPNLWLWNPAGAFYRQTVTTKISLVRRNFDFLPVHTPHLEIRLQGNIGLAEGIAPDELRPLTMSAVAPNQARLQLVRSHCPHHLAIALSSPIYQKHLPYRFWEFNEIYGVLNREVYGAAREEATVVCAEDQLHRELYRCMACSNEFFKSINIKVKRFKFGSGLQLEPYWGPEPQLMYDIRNRKQESSVAFMVQGPEGEEQLGMIRVVSGSQTYPRVPFTDSKSLPQFTWIIYHSLVESLERLWEIQVGNRGSASRQNQPQAPGAAAQTAPAR